MWMNTLSLFLWWFYVFEQLLQNKHKQISSCLCKTYSMSSNVINIIPTLLVHTAEFRQLLLTGFDTAAEYYK